MSFLALSLFLACQETENANSDKPVENKKMEKPVEIATVQNFGAPFSIEKAIPAADLFKAPETYVGKKIRVEATVTDVCQKMGCWMVITEQDKHMRITTKAHKFFVAKDGAGSLCQIEGEVVAKELDPERTAHFESESSKGAPIPEKQAKENKTYEIVASSIQFLGKK